MAMKILLLGSQGQLGWELRRSLVPLGSLIALGHHSPGGDLSQPEILRHAIRQHAPDVIVNAAAFTAVDRAESEADSAYRVNAQALQILSAEASRLDAWLLHYSTDYVFDGSGTRPWKETDAPAPLNVYGRTKLAGEQAVQASACRHLIFRTSWVYAARGGNFARTMLGLAQTRDQLHVVDDQIGAPTGAELLADISALALRRAMRDPTVGGLYHLTAMGETSWYEYAQFVLAYAQQRGVELKVSPQAVEPVPSDKYPQVAARPRNSRLDTKLLQSAFGLVLPPWQVGVTRMLDEILSK